MTVSEYPIDVQQICIGLFVRLDEQAVEEDVVRWPFPRKALKITDEGMVNALKLSGLKHLLVVLDKSDSMPLPLHIPEDLAAPPSGPGPDSGGAPASGTAEGDAPAFRTPLSAELRALKRETLERNRERQSRYARCEEQYTRSVSQVAGIIRRVSGKNAAAVDEAAQVAKSLAHTFLSERDVLLNVITTKSPEERQHFHSLNVAVLSMMVGAELGLDEATLNTLGMGALLHDIGKGRMPATSLQGGQMQLKLAIRKYYHQHPVVGGRLAADLPNVPRGALPIIVQHHEALDGTGFPKGLAGESLHRLARIVTVVDRYDNLCTQGGQQDEPREDEEGLIPHQAMKHLYNRSRSKLDELCLTTFIRCLGVYPPGSVVQLSNGLFGMVVSTNPKRATRPSVMVYHPEVPRMEALIIDLSIEDGLEIQRCLRPEALSRAALKYLSPSRMLGYYADVAPGA
ncbi:HD-GYP domain-containing protein [Megalodesulfovibrio paquesii]